MTQSGRIAGAALAAAALLGIALLLIQTQRSRVELHTVELVDSDRCAQRSGSSGADGTTCFLRVPAGGELAIATEPAEAADRLHVTLSADARSDVVIEARNSRWLLPPSWRGALALLDVSPPAGTDTRITSIRLSGEKQPTFRLPRSIQTPEAAPGSPSEPRPPNVIVYLIDTLRADHMSLYGYSRETTPRIAKWADSAYVFDNAYSSGSKTLEAIPALFASRLGLLHLQPRDGIEAPVVAELFRNIGYRTAAFQANLMVMPAMGYARGFDNYTRIYGEPTMRNGRERPSAGSADQVQDEALGWIDEAGDEAFFLYLQTMDPHTPYTAPAGFAGRFSKQADQAGPPKGRTDQMFDANLYDECVAYADDAFGRFIDQLEARGLHDNTLIVLTADHGESLGDGPFKNRYSHGRSLHEEIVRIPFALRLPRQTEGARVPDLVSLIDIAPTIVEAAGIPPPDQFLGESLFGERRRRAVAGIRVWRGEQVSSFVREGQWKLVRSETGNELYDLESDPAGAGGYRGRSALERSLYGQPPGQPTRRESEGSAPGSVT